MAPSVLPQFVDPRDPQSVAVVNPPAPVLNPRSVTSTAWMASATISIPATETVIYLKSLFGYNKGAAQWLHIFDLSAVPSLGAATAIAIVPMPANSQFYLDVPGSRGLGFITKFVCAISTTETTFTQGAADMKLALAMIIISGGV